MKFIKIGNDIIEPTGLAIFSRIDEHNKLYEIIFGNQYGTKTLRYKCEGDLKTVMDQIWLNLTIHEIYADLTEAINCRERETEEQY